MSLADTLSMIAMNSLEAALMILLIFTAFGMIIGGRRGAAWVLRTAFAPVKAILERRIAGIIQICGMTIASYYIGSLLR